MNKLKCVLGICMVLLAVVCVVTCPDKEAHVTVIKDRFSAALLSPSGDDGEVSGWDKFKSMIGTSVLEFMIDNELQVDNYFVLSVGRIPYDGESRVVSVGVLNHVFTMSEEEIAQAAEEASPELD